MITRLLHTTVSLLLVLVLLLVLGHLLISLYNALPGQMLSRFQQLIRPSSPSVDRGANLPSPPVPSIQSIQRQMDLTLLKTNLSTTGRGKLEGFTGSVHARIEVHGEATWGVDWRKISLQPAPGKPDTLILTAPGPAIKSIHVDVQASQVDSVRRKGLWIVLPMSTREEEVIQEAYRTARDQLEQYAREQTHLIPMVKEQFEHAIKPILEMLGWRVEVRWRE